MFKWSFHKKCKQSSLRLYVSIVFHTNESSDLFNWKKIFIQKRPFVQRIFFTIILKSSDTIIVLLGKQKTNFKQYVYYMHTHKYNQPGLNVSKYFHISPLPPQLSPVICESINTKCHIQYFHFRTHTHSSIFIIEMPNLTFTQLQIVCGV